MTQEQKQIAIAKACGWEFIKWGKSSLKIFHPSLPLGSVMAIPLNGRSIEEAKLDYISALPDYINDLNAMHEAEKVLTWQQHLTFRVRLWDLVVKLGPDDTWDRQFISATATQRAEAFGLTLNLWK